MATLKIRLIVPEDSGHYTLFAENAAGCIVSSAFLAVEAVGVQDELEFKSTRPSTTAANGIDRRDRPM